MFWSAMVLAAALLTGDVLYDNGPFVTHLGTGEGGADESLLQESLGLTAYGFGHAVAVLHWVADDFAVPAGETWDIGTITFFAYQTYAPTSPSTMTTVYLQIWDDVPGTPTADLVYGDAMTNRLTSSEWASCYRVLAVNGDTMRPIMANVCELSPGVELGEGTYWIAWQAAGTLTSGPWVPPITVLGQTTTGNAMQSADGGTTYAPLLDTGFAQGLPFILAETDTPVERTSWGAVKALFR